MSRVESERVRKTTNNEAIDSEVTQSACQVHFDKNNRVRMDKATITNVHSKQKKKVFNR